MRVEIEKAALAEALAKADRFSVSAYMSVEGQILFKTENGKCSLYAFKSGMFARIPVGADIDGDGSFMVSSQKLKAACAKIPDGVIILSESDGTVTIRISGRKLRYALKGMNPRNFPDFPGSDGLDFIAGAADTFVAALDYVKKSASNDITRSFMNGVYVRISDGGVRCVATDGRRLALSDDKNFSPAITKELAFVIPNAFVDNLCAVIDADVIEFARTETSLVVRNRDDVYITPLCSGEYPRYERVIPNAQSKRFSVDSRELRDALEHIGVIRGAVFKVLLEMSSGVLRLDTNTDEVGEASEELSASGDDIKAAFNGLYLKDALEPIKADRIDFEFTDSNRAFTVRGTGENRFSVLMPMNL